MSEIRRRKPTRKKRKTGKMATNSLRNHLAAPANACGKLIAILIKVRTILRNALNRSNMPLMAYST